MVWNIRAKLFTLVIVAALGAALLAALAFAMLHQVSRAVEHTTNLSSAIRLQGDADMMHDAIYGNVLAGMLASTDRDAAAHAEAAKSFAENAARFRKDLSGLSEIEVGTDTLAKLRAVKPALDAYIGAAEAFFRGGIGAADARAVLAKATRSYEELAEPMEKLSDSIEGDIDAAAAALAQRQRTANIALVFAALGGIGVIAFAGWRIGRSISAPLALAVTAVQTVAAGDLTQELPEGRRDEIGELLHALNAMRESLAGMFVIFQVKAGELDDASHGLVNAAARVTQGSAQQRDASASIAATLHRMNGSIESVAESMGTSRELAQRVGDASASGTRVIERLIADMSRIESSVKFSASDIARLGEESRNIGAVVSVIKEIADQTNLLALNAAIEAARAGEQGRGFAVVADEVRKLAERTANSTEQIGTMIERIVGQVSTTVKGVQEGVTMVEAGMQSAQDANAVLEDITRGVQDVVANVIQAADAMREQAGAVQHVSASAERITAMSEQNAKVSEDTEQSARALSGVSETLRVSAATFKVKEKLPPAAALELAVASRAQEQGGDRIDLF